jgi:hypothetical protein
MNDIDSVLYLLGAVLAVDGLTPKEIDYIKQNVFNKLEKAHLHVELEPHKIAIYMKHKIPDMVSEIHDIYTAKTNTADFKIPESIKNNCIKHIKHLKDHIKKEDLVSLIKETILVDGQISSQEEILCEFIFAEIDKTFS